MDYSEEQYDAAIDKAMRKPDYLSMLAEAADMFLALESDQDLSDFKRDAARVLLESAIRATGNKTRASKRISINRKSVERILHNDSTL